MRNKKKEANARKRNAREETVSNRYPVSVRNIKVDIS